MDHESHLDPREAGAKAPSEPRMPLEVGEITDEMRQFLLRMFQFGSSTDRDDRREMTGYRPTMSDLQQGDLTPMLSRMPEILRVMMHHPKLFTQITEIGIQLTANGALSPRERELAILRVAWLCHSPYQWGEQVLIANKIGINSEEIERITQGSGASGWSEHEQSILRASEELHENAKVSDSTWSTLSTRFNNQQLLELIVVVGQYQMLAYFVNSLNLHLLNGNMGLVTR